MIHIVAPGLRSTVQDRGRSGHLRDAVPPAGPADPQAFAAANALVGDPPGAAAIEIVGLPFRFVSDDTRVVAATGRDVRIRGRDDLPGWTAVLARAGAEMTVEGSGRTRYAYLAVAGGIDLPPVLGSRSTYLPAALGPLPRALAAGDLLPVGPARAGADRAGRDIRAPAYDVGRVRAVRGPHDDRFERGEMEVFFASTFTASGTSDRMGLRLLTSERPLRRPGGELLTCAALPGAVQVPSGGDPIVLLADHQTTGGYAIIATVIAADIGRIAQATAGDEVRFYEVDREAAVEALRDERRWLTI